MSSSTPSLIPTILYGILVVLFLGLGIYSLIFERRLKLYQIKKEDLTALNEFGQHIFFSPKLGQLLLKLPVLVRFVSWSSFIGFILSAIALVIQVWQ